MKEKRIKGESIETWLKWIDNELTPPITVNSEQKYVLEAFKESLKLLEI